MCVCVCVCVCVICKLYNLFFSYQQNYREDAAVAKIKYLKIPLANVVRLVAERFENQSNVKLDGFRSRLRASCVSSHTEEFW